MEQVSALDCSDAIRAAGGCLGKYTTVHKHTRTSYLFCSTSGDSPFVEHRVVGYKYGHCKSYLFLLISEWSRRRRHVKARAWRQCACA